MNNKFHRRPSGSNTAGRDHTVDIGSVLSALATAGMFALQASASSNRAAAVVLWTVVVACALTAVGVIILRAPRRWSLLASFLATVMVAMIITALCAG